MKIVSGKIYALRIPFVEAFAHSAKNRKFSDSFVVQLVADDGTVGYGEGLARPYVTGETVETSVEHIKDKIFPAIETYDFREIETGIAPLDAFQTVTESLPVQDSSDEIVWNAARAAVESAIIDCLLKRKKLSLGAILPPARNFVTYSGVITSGTIETAVQHAKRFKLFNLRQIKIKIGGGSDDVSRLAAIRQAVGGDVSLRVDANGAFDLRSAAAIAEKLAEFDIDAFEQPMPRGDLKNWTELKKRSPIPIMVDESLVTFDDAQKLIENSACDFFNLRISKCGGISAVLRIAELARKHNIRLQLGCQVGETAILSAIGRHVAAYLEGAEFVEGSYGNLLLAEDISRNNVNFGHGGRAPLMRGTGFGVEVREEILEKYAHRIIKLGKEKVFYA
jgi:muconate cycloisomerase